MAKIDKIKEFIGWLKVLFALFFGVDVFLRGYLFLHFEEIYIFKAVLVIISLIISLNITLYSKILEKIEELEDL